MSALSGGGLKRFAKSVGDTMFQLTTKMSESDQVRVCCLKCLISLLQYYKVIKKHSKMLKK